MVRETLAPIRIPAVSVNLTPPVVHRQARLRALRARPLRHDEGASAWSKPFGFDMRWEDTPIPHAGETRASSAGRRSKVRPATRSGTADGARAATSTRSSRRTRTSPTSAICTPSTSTRAGGGRCSGAFARCARSSARFRTGCPPSPTGRGRRSTRPPTRAGPRVGIRLGAAVSDRVSARASRRRTSSCPRSRGPATRRSTGRACRLFRVYVVHGQRLRQRRVQGLRRRQPRVRAARQRAAQAAARPRSSSRAPSTESFRTARTRTPRRSPPTPSRSSSNEIFDQDRTLLRVDLPDLDARTTRYFWTVVPVVIVVNPETGEFEYWDYESPQDACQAGRDRRRSARTRSRRRRQAAARSSPASHRTDASSPRRASRPTVFATPLVAWRPVVGATEYEVQWSRVTYPWRKRGSLEDGGDVVPCSTLHRDAGTTASAGSTAHRSARPR